jgi:hypothetical protein
MTDHECVHTEDIRAIARDMRELRRSNAEIREKLFNGIADTTRRIPEIEKTLHEMQTALALQGSSKSIMTKRGLDAAVIGVIVAVVSQWGHIAEFIARLL